MIQFISVSKVYPNQYQALDNVNFEIAEGEFVFLIGPSGSGKTTIIRHLIREELPSEGKIYFDNEDITKYKRKHVYELRRKIGVVFQDYKLIQDKNTYENIEFAMEAAGKSPKDIAETVPYVLDIVGLLDKAYAFPNQLSGGEKQRVAIARAISNNPKLLIADEPTGNLDPDAAWDIVQILSKINNWGTTVIMATHGSNIVDALGKRVIALVDGAIVKDVLKGTYKDIELQIDKEKRNNKASAEKLNKPELITPLTTAEKSKTVDSKKKSTDEKQSDKKDKNKEEKAEKNEAVEAPKNKTSKESEKLEKDAKAELPTQVAPPISLTQRRKAHKVKNDEFEKLVQDSLDKPKASKKQTAKSSETEAAAKAIEQEADISVKNNSKATSKITLDTDLKNANLNPKLASILKAFGYSDVKSITDAGYKKISKIEGLSANDLKTVQNLINQVKSEKNESTNI